MLKVTYQNQNQSRLEILSYVKEQKRLNSNYRVIDVGGVAYSWTDEIADVIVDINATRTQDFKINISNDWEYISLLDYVQQYGKFDYAICTHTLEDITHPATAFRNLPKIAKSGIITMPTIFTELSRIENIQWLGYIHHRYLFDYIDDTIVYAPKLSFLERILGEGFKEQDPLREIRFHWQDEIKYKPFMDDYLGPNAKTVFDKYQEFVYSSINKSQNTVL